MISNWLLWKNKPMQTNSGFNLEDVEHGKHWPCLLVKSPVFNTDQYGKPLKFPWILISFPKKIAMAGCTSGLLYPIFRQIHIALTTKMWNVSSGMVLLVFVSGLEGLCLAYMDAVILSFFLVYICIYIDVDYIVYAILYTITMPYMQLYFPDISGMCTPWVVPLENHHCRRTSS